MVIRAVAVIAAAAVALAIIALRVKDHGDEQVRYPLPDDGVVEAIVGPGDAPAFLARHRDGTVRAFLGIAPHSALPLAWCAAAESFVEPVGAARFDIAGRYTSGPAPGGLRPFEVDVVESDAVVGELLEPPPRMPAGVVSAAADICVGTEGHVLGLHPPIAQLGGPLPPWQAARNDGWVRVQGALESDGDRFRVCPTTLDGCATDDVVARQLFDGLQPRPGERVVGEFVALADDGEFAALAAPFGLATAEGRDDGEAPADESAPWCGEAELVEFRGDFDASPVDVEVEVADIRPVEGPSGCDYGAPSPPHDVVGDNLLVRPERISTLDYLFSGPLVPAAVQAAGGPFPALGSPDDLSSDGIVTPDELGIALDVPTPVTVVVRYDGGALTGFWIPRPD